MMHYLKIIIINNGFNIFALHTNGDSRKKITDILCQASNVKKYYQGIISFYKQCTLTLMTSS